MDRRESPRTLGSSSMRISRPSKINLLLSSCSRQGSRSITQETSRRDLYRESFLRFEKDQDRAQEGGIRSESKTCPRNHERTRVSRKATWTKNLKEPSGAYQVSLFAERIKHREANASMEQRHYLHSFIPGVYISYSDHRLVQSSGSSKSLVKQPRGFVLHRSIRRGNSEIWMPRDFQYRSRSAVYLPGVCGSRCKSRNTFQYGWQGKGFRQCIHRTVMEIFEI